jgi:hypothetical protein
VHVLPSGRAWLNSGAMVGYAGDIRRLLRMAWREYREHASVYRAFTDQQLLCFLLSDGASIWTRAVVGIDHMSELALSTYRTDVRLGGPGRVLGLDTLGRVVFSNRTVPAIIHFNGPAAEKAGQIEYAREHFPLLSGL